MMTVRVKFQTKPTLDVPAHWLAKMRHKAIAQSSNGVAGSSDRDTQPLGPALFGYVLAPVLPPTRFNLQSRHERSLSNDLLQSSKLCQEMGLEFVRLGAHVVLMARTEAERSGLARGTLCGMRGVYTRDGRSPARQDRSRGSVRGVRRPSCAPRPRSWRPPGSARTRGSASRPWTSPTTRACARAWRRIRVITRGPRGAIPSSVRAGIRGRMM